MTINSNLINLKFKISRRGILVKNKINIQRQNFNYIQYLGSDLKEIGKGKLV